MRLEKELKDAKKKKDKAKEAALQAELELLMKSGLGKKIGPSWMHKEEIELEEGRMKELHMYIQQGKSAKEIAKLMKLDVKTIKALMSEAWELGTNEYREYLERLTPGEMYYLPSENNPNNPRTYDPNQPVDIDEAKFQVKTAKTKRGRISVKEFDNLNAAKKYLE